MIEYPEYPEYPEEEIDQCIEDYEWWASQFPIPPEAIHPDDIIIVQ